MIKDTTYSPTYLVVYMEGRDALAETLTYVKAKAAKRTSSVKDEDDEHFNSKGEATDDKEDIPKETPCPFREFDDVKEDRKKFLNNQRLMLTYKTHLPKNEFEDWFVEKIKFEPTFFRMAHETGDRSHAYDHTHVVVDFGKQYQCNNCRWFDFTDIHPNIKLIKSAKHFENAKMYLAKEDPENKDLAFKPCLYTVVSNCENKSGVLKLCKKPSDAQGLLTLWDNRLKEEESCKIHKITRWQKQAFQLMQKPKESSSSAEEYAGLIPYTQKQIDDLMKKPHKFKSGRDRKLTVYWQPKGCGGKTWFGKQLMIFDPKRFYMIQGVGSMRDVATQIHNGVANGWTGEILLINISRSCADHKIYNVIESLRDGILSTQKFNGETFTYGIKDLVIFTNFMPNLEQVSIDRWTIYEIDSKTMFASPMNIDRAKAIFDMEKEDRVGRNSKNDPY